VTTLSSDVALVHDSEMLRQRYAPRINRLVQRVLGSDSEHEDLVHDILLTVFTRIGTLRDPHCADQWVKQVALNMLNGAVRKRRYRRLAPPDAELDLPARPFDVEARELAVRALDVVERLPQADRTLLERRWFSRAPMRELATHYGCSVITVARRLRRAQARFDRLAGRDPALARLIGKTRRRTSQPD
jgi:RNA polymerase sigma-70 factor (ECF subfamily)